MPLKEACYSANGLALFALLVSEKGEGAIFRVWQVIFVFWKFQKFFSNMGSVELHDLEQPHVVDRQVGGPEGAGLVPVNGDDCDLEEICFN